MRPGNGEIRPRNALRTSRLASSWSGKWWGRTALQSDLRSCRSSLRQRLAPGAGFEPATNRLTADCSTAELSGIARPIAYSKSGLLRKDRATRGRTRRTPVRAERGAGMSLPLQGSVARPRAPLLDIARSRKREHTASWRSGYAEDCKSLHPGSIPGEASKPPPSLSSITARAPRARGRALAFCRAIHHNPPCWRSR